MAMLRLVVVHFLRATHRGSAFCSEVARFNLTIRILATFNCGGSYGSWNPLMAFGRTDPDHYSSGDVHSSLKSLIAGSQGGSRASAVRRSTDQAVEPRRIDIVPARLRCRMEPRPQAPRTTAWRGTEDLVWTPPIDTSPGPVNTGRCGRAVGADAPKNRGARKAPHALLS